MKFDLVAFEQLLTLSAAATAFAQKDYAVGIILCVVIFISAYKRY